MSMRHNVEIELPDKEVLELGDIIKVRASVTDDISGVDYVYAVFKPETISYRSLYIYLKPVYGENGEVSYYEGLSDVDLRGCVSQK
ncbi:hypothetical protein [Niallia sp. Man26]|uniref:hypothetical protein n=1 Tax=Niallia sp. Man26 TaxID=2912824 RepID=UPI00204DD52B|nr:hypothetical protein [Niallia sp. Man26]UPO90513.1 hypothetical protein L8T27_020895 [Niallia sp. Man26]